jgi:hypothetical protein
MFDADIVIVSRLAGVLESALQTETFLSRSRIAEQVGMENSTFHNFLRNRKKLAHIVGQIQLHTSPKNRLYQEMRARQAQKKQERKEREECRRRGTRRCRRLEKLLRWKAQWKYDKAVAIIQKRGLTVTRQSIARGAKVRANTVSEYLRRHPHLSKRYGICRRQRAMQSTTPRT